jgi:(p)ppGpp synthase/HD superfamily hydrolase
MSDQFCPLSERPVHQLRAKADEYRQMARTARTADVEASLLRLADRLDALADKRAWDIRPE